MVRLGQLKPRLLTDSLLILPLQLIRNPIALRCKRLDRQACNGSDLSPRRWNQKVSVEAPRHRDEHSVVGASISA